MHQQTVYYYFLGRKIYGMLPHEAMAWAIAVCDWWWWQDNRPEWWHIGPMPHEDKFRTHTKPSYIDGVWQYSE